MPTNEPDWANAMVPKTYKGDPDAPAEGANWSFGTMPDEPAPEWAHNLDKYNFTPGPTVFTPAPGDPVNHIHEEVRWIHEHVGGATPHEHPGLEEWIREHKREG